MEPWTFELADRFLLNLYEQCVVGGHPSTAVFNVLQPGKDAQICEVGTTLATLTLGSLTLKSPNYIPSAICWHY